MRSFRPLPTIITLTTILGIAVTALAFYPLSLTAEAAAAQSDERAIEIAERTMETMGGEEAWNNTRYISWKFFGRNLHVWDKWTGRHRIERQSRDGDAMVMLINTNDWNGRVWRNGEEVTDPDDLAAQLNGAMRSWINDGYWIFMPYKLRDPGVTLRYVGEKAMEDGRMANVVELTFEEVGVTPNNKYEVFVANDTGLVEQWSHWTNRDDPEPRFTNEWSGWQQFGNIMLSTNRGRDADWEIQVFDDLPDSVFTDPAPLSR